MSKFLMESQSSYEQRIENANMNLRTLVGDYQRELADCQRERDELRADNARLNQVLQNILDNIEGWRALTPQQASWNLRVVETLIDAALHPEPPAHD